MVGDKCRLMALGTILSDGRASKQGKPFSPWELWASFPTPNQTQESFLPSDPKKEERVEQTASNCIKLPLFYILSPYVSGNPPSPRWLLPLSANAPSPSRAGVSSRARPGAAMWSWERRRSTGFWCLGDLQSNRKWWLMWETKNAINLPWLGMVYTWLYRISYTTHLWWFLGEWFIVGLPH